MQTQLRVYGFKPNGDKVSDEPIISQYFPEGVTPPIPNRKDSVCYQYWELEVFHVKYAYTDKTVFVDVLAIWDKETWKRYNQ